MEKPKCWPATSSISWDPGSAALRAVSHPGNEGGYKYLMEALVKDAAAHAQRDSQG